MKYDPYEKDRHYFSFTPEEIENLIKEFEGIQDGIDTLEERVLGLRNIFEEHLYEHHATQDALDE